MTVSTTTSSAQFDPNGVTINFPFAFRFFAATDLKVFWQKPDGTIQLLTLNSNYTVQGAGNNAGGSITTIGTPLPNGLLVVSRIMVATQLTSFRNQGEFFAEIHEDAFDKLVMLVQQTIDSQGRGLTVPVADPLNINLVLPGANARSGMVLAFDAEGSVVVSNLTLEQIEQQPALALESAAAAEASAEAAETAETSATESAQLAAKLAQNPEDVPVSPGLFSAFHWARKALVSASSAAATLANAVQKTGAQVMAGPLTVTNGISSIPFNKSYVSSPQVQTSGALLTLAHGLAVPPKLVRGVLICTVAELGYSIGFRMDISLAVTSAANSQGISIGSDATNIYVRFGSNATIHTAVNNTNGNGAALTNANWRLEVTAFA